MPIIADVPVETKAAEKPEGKPHITPVHTLKDDLQHVVREQKISVVRAASLEQDRRTRERTKGAAPTPAQAQRGRRTFNILFAAALLLLLGAAALGGVYLIAQERAGVEPAQTYPSLLFAESTIGLTLSGQSPSDIKRTLGNARASARGTLGSITRIVPVVSETKDGIETTRAATFTEFMQAISAGAPDALERASGSDFFFGIHAVDKNAPLLVVPITSYDRAFAAMLSWEPTINAGLVPMFAPLSAQTIDQNGLPTTRAFQDVVMRNYDVRALKDDAGNVAFYYSFPTRELLIIAESPFSFAEVLSRLQAERKL